MDGKENTTRPYPAEFRERAVQMVVDHLDSYASLTAAVRDIADKLGCSPDSQRAWYKQARRDAGKEAGPTSAGRARIKERERENRELRQGEEGQKTVQWAVFPTNEILKKGEPAKAVARRGAIGPSPMAKADLQEAADHPVHLVRTQGRAA
ncbi:transposase [Rhodovulum steppense]|uniref:Transposase n=1 Tax=Rhodovulum steppense TaxID=540251 RepID=A0A4R1YZL0_9RHOB|nr:transposase [Rhodovulum steppense]TCM86627.1 transposase [Rhodovulum steppense]